MAAEVLLDGVWVRALEIRGYERVEELDKSLGGARGEAIDRVRDDVGVDVFIEVEADSAAARACIGIVVGNVGDAGEIGEPHRYGSGTSLDMRCPSERSGLRRRRERSREENPLRVRRPEARVNAAIGLIEGCEGLSADS